MSDTSLISSETATQPSSETEVKTETLATDTPEGGDKGNIADTMYDHETSGGGKGDEKPEEKTEDKTEGDDKGDEKPEGDDKAKDKTDDGEKDREGKDKDDKDDKDEDGDVEPFDLSDIEVELPEGMELDQEVLGELGELASQIGVKSKEDAAKLVPLGVKLVENAFAKQQEQYKATRSEWVGQVASDKEIGGVDEAARKEKLAVASRGLDAIGSPELRTLLDATGLGDHPEVIRAFYKAGLSASEDRVETGGSGDTTNGLDAMYPTMADKK